MTFHPLAYHRIPMANPDLQRGFWFPVIDDRVAGTANVRVGERVPPAYIAQRGQALLTWRPA